MTRWPRRAPRDHARLVPSCRDSSVRRFLFYPAATERDSRSLECESYPTPSECAELQSILGDAGNDAQLQELI